MSTENMNLFNIKQENDTEYDKKFFEQYRLYVELMDRISQRRSIANNFFITANSLILTATSSLLKDRGHSLYLISAVGIFISIFWFFIIRSYKQLNSGKFNVIHEIEKQLPLNLFAYEWDVLAKGKSYSTYWPFSHIEGIIPFIFIALYLALSIFIYCNF